MHAQHRCYGRELHPKRHLPPGPADEEVEFKEECSRSESAHSHVRSSTRSDPPPNVRSTGAPAQHLEKLLGPVRVLSVVGGHTVSNVPEKRLGFLSYVSWHVQGLAFQTRVRVMVRRLQIEGKRRFVDAKMHGSGNQDGWIAQWDGRPKVLPFVCDVHCLRFDGLGRTFDLALDVNKRIVLRLKGDSQCESNERQQNGAHGKRWRFSWSDGVDRARERSRAKHGTAHNPSNEDFIK